MFDSWISESDSDLLAGAALVDMSAAFDVVDTERLLEKCNLYNFKPVHWLWSYLTERTQRVYIGGSLSNPLPLEAGVPQGPILGHALYTLYTCDFPEVVHKTDCPYSPENRAAGEEQLVVYRTMCTECGVFVCYADDSQYTVTADDEVKLSVKLTRKFNVMAEYMYKYRQDTLTGALK